MSEKAPVTNEILFREINDCTNQLLKETAMIRTNQNVIIDELHPTYLNARNIHQMVYDLGEKVSTIETKIDKILFILNKLSIS